ncbi:hypothetical protein A5634_22295 [Mycobacterium asiaticum]|uniref:4Fe-4S Wbl-type domain-containing protein n=1 Tax=Mycobacterium asiaticum TaxID=1790 RepID=A0A1A3P1Z7_MYCAS|nr:hypothetical protein [Mycobacterium asiaticum]OBK27700.1 hypothetical protein A5634_22295 [Mycobacterium asiaticum]
MSLAEFLTMARDTVPLPGAACRGRPEDFDVEDPKDPRLAAAVESCRSCPALDACAEWLAALTPGQRPTGVVAGRLVRPYHRPNASRPKTKARRAGPRPGDLAADGWLAERLAAGPAAVPELAREARARGIARPTLYAACKRMGIETTGGTGRDDPAVWRLPAGQPQPKEREA